MNDAWLEDVLGETQLDWVRQRNAASAAELAETSRFADIKREILEVLDSKDNLPAVRQRGEYLYNYWKDADHPRGLWRRTTWDEYRKDSPEWDVLLDLDALAEAEGESWVWHGASVLRPAYNKALISLSPGGSDADVVREFDMETRTFVEGGFTCPESKGSVSWADTSGDVVFVARDFGEGTMTRSGYPMTVRRWERATDLDHAPEIFRGEESDVFVGVSHDFTRGFDRDFTTRAVGFFDFEVGILGDQGPELLDVPTSATPLLHKNWLMVRLREDWDVAGTVWPGGSLLVIDLPRFREGARDFTALFTPTPTTALSDVTCTLSHVVLTVMEDVTNRLELFVVPDAADGEWTSQPVDLPFEGLSDLASIDVAAVDTEESDDLWLFTTDFITPTTLNVLRLDEAGKTVELEALKSEPAFFDASDFKIEQHFATSDDGTRVPYFQISAGGEGPKPTLLYGYGGFEIALQPAYSPLVGRAWLARGGTYVVANIRGGGEYGPAWHTSALKENRHRAYEDFSSVAKDLVRRGVTDAAHLGIQGGSNGGLLMGVMYTLYPELFGAVVCQVPLLDMKRFSHLLAGASWMAEYGDPDTDDWEFIKTFSPYHLLDEAKGYPPILLTTSTKDDRVHPAHARKFQAALERMGKDSRYYENIEGGHGGAANNEQSAYLRALAYEFLWQQLGS